VSPKKQNKTMIPPHYFAAQLQAAQRRVREGIQAVPTMDPDGTVAPGQQPDGYFNDCVLDLSRYLTSSDLPATPREFFDDLFHEKNGAAAAGAADNPALNKPLSAHHHHAAGGVIKVKEEPDSTATSRCSTPESLLPEHDFDNGEFPTPKFQTGNEPGVNAGGGGKDKSQGGGSLMCQLQSMQNSSSGNHGSTITTLNNNNNTDGDSNDSHSDVEMDMENLDINAQKLKAALAQLKHNNNNNTGTANRESSEYRFPSGADSRDGEGTPGEGPTTPVDGLSDGMPHLHQPHKNPLKSPRSKSRKSIEKGTDEYIVKRERNNVAVRKSRTKAKLKHIETQMRVGELTEENEQLRNRVASLQKELNALKSFISYNCPGNVKPPCFSSSTSYPPQQIFSTKIM
jgi:hypothetical protein